MPKARQLHPNMLAVRSFKIQPLIWPIVVELWMSFVANEDSRFRISVGRTEINGC